MTNITALPAELIEAAVRAALAEDLGEQGDITSAATIPADARAVATFGARKPGVVAGMPFAAAAFRALDPLVVFTPVLNDGDRVEAGGIIARVEGNARAVLSGERVALNYMGHLSGIATATAALVDAVRHTKARILDTRKTTPGLRLIEKYAVACGGGVNHRIGLFDAVLIKDNHIAVAGGVAQAIRAARNAVRHSVKVEVEVGTLDELREALTEDPDIIMLDNMSPDMMREAVGIVDGRAVTEASGTVTLATVAQIAETGVDTISSGWITHSAPTLDIGLDIVI